MMDVQNIFLLHLQKPFYRKTIGQWLIDVHNNSLMRNKTAF